MPSHADPDIYVYIDTPAPIFRARLNMPTVTYPVTELVFDTVSLGAFGDIQADMTIVIGSTLGGDDYGRLRVQNTATSTTIPVGRVSRGLEDGQALITDNAFLEVWEDYRVWSKLPYETLDDPSTTYKDSDVLVGDFNQEIPPVAIMGAGCPVYIDPDTELATIAFDGSLSYPMAEGATITSYAWVLPVGATVTVGAINVDSVTATFPAGKYWVQLTVTDSNGKGHSTRRRIIVIDPANDPTLRYGAVELQRLTIGGQTLTIRLFGDMPRTTVPDGALVMMWHGAPSSPSDRSHLKFYGWIQSETWGMRAVPGRGLVRDTVLTCLDVAGRLDTLPGFPQALERNAEEAHWAFMPLLNISRALHYLLHWHSTALVVADFHLPTTGDAYPAMRLDSAGASLFDQVNSRALSMVPDHYLCCGTDSALRVLPDWQLMDDGDRPAASAIVTEDDCSEIRADYSRPPKVYALRSSAVVASTDWEVDPFGEDTLPIAFCIAPGDAGAFGQGVSEATTGEKLTISQALLNICEGHRFARLNSRDGLYSIVLTHSDDVWDLQPALIPRIQVNVAAEYAAQRGLPFTQTNGLIKEINIRYPTSKGGVYLAPTASLERETFGYPATTIIPPEVGVPDFENPPPPIPTVPPPVLRSGQQQLVGVDINRNVYRTIDFDTVSGSGGPTYEEVPTGITEEIYSFVMDPFSPGKAPGATSGSIDGWVATEDAIYKLSNLFGTLVVDEVLTFATSAVAASFHWRTIQASFGAFFAEGVNPWLLCVSYYGDTAGHEGTWATRSLDGGATWSTEAQIAAGESLLDNAMNPIGVYTSPKTPGLAYTVAYAAENPAEPLPSLHAIDDNTTIPSTPPILKSRTGLDYTVGKGGSETYNQSIFVIPPADAVRVVVQHHAVLIHIISGGAGATSSYTMSVPAFVIESDVVDVSPLTFTRHVSVTEWPGNIDELGTIGMTRNDYLHFDVAAHAVWGGGGQASITISQRVTVTEIELEDGTIYTPDSNRGVLYTSPDWGAAWAPSDFFATGYAQGGSIHLPWDENTDEQLAYFGHFDLDADGYRQFRLKRSVGGVITDISPSDGTRSYGVNKYGFAIRAFDPDRQYLLASVIGNDTTTDPADDLHAVYASVDGGDNWTEVIAPTPNSEAPVGRPIYEAAYSGTDPLVHFYWGKPEWIAYSADGGVTVDSRAGNLGSFSPEGFIGIAGGLS